MRPRTVTQRIAGGILFALGMPALLFAQNENVEEKGWFMPDRGQFHDKVRFRSSLPGGKFYIEEKGFSYLQVDGEKIAELHHRVRGDKDPPLSEFSVDAHSVKVDLMGAATPSFEKEGRSGYYANFYRGKDPSEHAEKVHTYEEVILSGIYEGVALRFERKPHGIKYSFECDPHAKIANIRMRYQGQEKLEITEDGGLRIHTSLGDIREKAPKAYQWIDGRKKAIPCRFTVQDSAVGFRFPKGYEEDRPLIIDPNVIFSTYTGSTSDNWGNTATYDSDGALYAGGTVFGSGYPTTTGAYQLNFGGGSGGLGCDVSISKFAPDGTSLIYSTYLGGSANELPHSLVVDQMGRLYVLGSTGSSDFPTDSTAALPTFMGGNNGSAFGAIPFNNGTDAFVSKFSANGSTLLGSTYLGGTSNDGLNEAGSLNYNYGDILRGEVEVDGSGNAYVVSTTRSPDLPVTGSVFQDSLAGIQDAFVTKLNPDLSGILFCGYYGGDSTDAGYAIERNPGFGIYISGGTTSDNIPAPQGWQTSLQGGVDGFVARMDASASSVLNASYVGTSSYDQSYFVGRDSSDNILLYGQSTGTYPVVNASYSDPNSGQFIQMLPPDLNSSILSTVFGTGSGSVDISPSAFMVSECNNIYLSGWGGNVNQAHGVNSSSTSGLPITGNAYQSNTDGSDFYLMVLGDSASSLKYGSFFGGGVSDEHVDGGTSRFDDEGVVYQAVCGGCGGNSDFPTTPGAHSSQNNSSNCNLAAFKFDMSQLSADIGIQNPSIACQPDTFNFDFTGSGGTYYEWHLGDGTVDSGFSVSHYYSDTGTYQVTLVVHDTLTCRSTDTATTTIHIIEPSQAFVDTVSPICPGDSVQLNAGGGYAYHWSPAGDLSDPSIEDPIAFPDSTTQFQVIVDGCANDSTVIEDTAYVTVPLHNINSQAHGDSTICPNDSVSIHAEGGVSYSWTPSATLNDTSIADPLAFPTDSTLYEVTIIDSNGCANKDSVLIEFHTPPSLNTADTTVCKYDSAQFDVSGDPGTYQWDPVSGLNDPTLQDPTAYGSDTTVYNVTLTDSNGCKTEDSLTMNVLPPPPMTTHPDTILCQGDSLELWVNGGISQDWDPAASLSDTSIADPIAFPDSSTTYQVRITDPQGCNNYDSVRVNLVPLPSVQISSDTFMCMGDTMQLFAQGGSSYQWSPGGSLDDPTIPDPKATPSGDTDYEVLVTDSNGCKNRDSLTLWVDTLQPQPQAGNDTLICKWDSTQLWASGGHAYEWSPSNSLSNADTSVTMGSPSSTTTYMVDVINGCGTKTDSVLVEVKKVESNAGPDSTICPGDSLMLSAEGGTDYQWKPAPFVSEPSSSQTIAFPPSSTDYQVFVTDTNGCKDTGKVDVDLYQNPDLWVGDELKVQWGSKVELQAQGDEGSYLWHPEDLFEDPSSKSVVFRAKEARSFWVELTDSNGCRVVDSIDVLVSGSLYAPNAFTPDGDGLNDFWRVKGEAIGYFHLQIFDRWGELLFETHDMSESWDGMVGDHPAKPDVYVYKIVYTESYKPGIKKIKTGHITLVR